MKNKDLFLQNESIAYDFIMEYVYPWEVLKNIKNYIIELGSTLNDDFEKIGEDVWIHKNASVSESAEIHGPCIIDDGAEIRHSAFIRGSVIIGKNSVFGNSCEIKNAILFDNVQVPHFSYVGDSILGSHSHMGASSIISNLKSDKKNIVIKCDNELVETNLRKIGAFLGDNVEVGCGCVLNPGTIIMPNSNIYPLTSVRGVIPSNVIVKNMENIVRKEER